MIEANRFGETIVLDRSPWSTAMPAQQTEPNPVSPSLRVQAAEISVFLLLIVPSLALSLFVTSEGQVSFWLTATATIFRDVALVCLILYFLWRNGEAVSRIGWTWRRPMVEVILGVACFIPVFVAAALLQRALSPEMAGAAMRLPSFLKQQASGELLLAFTLVTVVAVAEETIFRGYLLLRLAPVLRSKTAAVVVSSAIFAIGHGYEGAAAMAVIGVLGVVFALVYLWRGSLIAPIVMHFLQDFIGIILLPMLGQQ